MIFGFATAQTVDSVATAGGNAEVYYNLETGTKYAVTASSWDIGLTSDMRDASIIINENAGVELFLYGNDTSEWSTLDTTGFAWENVYNSESTWAEGAFANQGTRHPDYGWGVYNMNTHDINGNRLFILKDKSGNYHKIVIDKMARNGEFTIRRANLDGSNAQTISYSKINPITKDRNFALMDLADGSVYAENPATTDWDIQFTKYITTVSMGPVTQDMSVSGVKINKGYQVAERRDVDVTSNDTSSLVWNTEITEIGYDWKSFDRSTFMYNMVEDLAYFIRTDKGSVWKIYFTDYQGGPAGQSNFVLEQIREAANVSDIAIANATQVYPNPATETLNVKNNEGNELSLSLKDIQGRQVQTSEVEAFGNAQIDVSALPSGIYFLQMSTESASATKRVIVD